MNQQTCNSNLFDAFLESELNETEEQQFTRHLADCADCREKLESRTAGQSAWQEAANLLSGFGSRSIFATGHHRTNTNCSPQIEQVIHQLAPPDDPEMLGRIGSYEVSGSFGGAAPTFRPCFARKKTSAFDTADWTGPER